VTLLQAVGGSFDANRQANSSASHSDQVLTRVSP
jgi:hypothetical protein